jgi:hypothetical protein
VGSQMSGSKADRVGDNQPMPVHSPGKVSVQSLVIIDIEKREQLGVSRYGTPLQTHNGRNALVDAYEECLDLCMYLKQRILEEMGP